MDEIKKHNQEAEQGLHSFTLGVNDFTDLTYDEFKSIYNRAIPPQRNSKNSNRANKVNTISTFVSNGTLPAEIGKLKSISHKYLPSLLNII